MRKITKEAVIKFYHWICFHKWNTEVFHLPGRYVLCLFNNKIAELDIKWNVVSVYDWGHQTQTTKERINWVLGYKWLGYVYQKDREWLYTDETWKTRPFAWGISRGVPIGNIANF